MKPAPQESLGIPVIAIVGRPNVGKSSIFNLLAGRRISIVEPTAGVTRDRITTWVEIDKRTVELIDTGGIGIVDVEKVREHVEQQIELALQAADVILFVVDVRTGTAPLDIEVAARIRTLGKPIVLVANKADEQKHELLANEFYELGLGDPIPLSATQGYGRTDLLDAIAPLLPAKTPEIPPEDQVPKLAVIGKRNAGKSTFVNALAQEERMIVSDLPGTTRDSVDVRFERDGQAFIAIDTAGMRKKQAVENAIELFSQARTRSSIERADVVLLMFDVTEQVSIVDKNLASWIEDNFKPCVMIGNKWDLAKKEILTGEWHEYVQKRLPGIQFSPMVFTSALQRKGVGAVLEIARDLYRQARVRISTGELNRAIEEAMKAVRPRARDGTMPKVYFATQTQVAPPTIVVFVNKPEAFDNRYRRYLVNRLREQFDFPEVPIRLLFRERLTIYDNQERVEKKHVLRKRAARAKRLAEKENVGSDPVDAIGPSDEAIEGEDDEFGEERRSGEEE